MRKIYLPVFLAGSLLLSAKTFAQPASVTLTPTVGVPVPYSSIGEAYAAIPAAPSQNYLIELLATYTGATETYPIQLTSKGLAPGGVSITIRPFLGNNAEVIQRTTPSAGVVLQFNGADNVILDGRPGGVASSAANYLTINDPFSGSNTNRNIELLNAANNNTIQFINSTAANATAAAEGSRNILVGSTTTTGNNNNIIQNCVVTGGLRGIQDFGLSDAAPNNGTIIRNNTVSNFGAIGIFAGSAQSNITIQNNQVTMQNYNVLAAGTLAGIQQQATIAGATSNIIDNTISLVTTSTTVTTITGISDLGTGTENILRNNITALSAPLPNASSFLVGISMGSPAGGGVATFNVSSNKISGLSSVGAVNFRGMSIFPLSGSTVNVNNNFVAITDPNAAASAIFGMLFGSITAGGSYTSNIYFNSVRVGGVQDAANNSTAYGILKSDANLGSVYNQKNNIVSMERTGGGATARFLGFSLGSTEGTLNINYNTYSATDPIAGFAAGGFDGFIYRNAGLAAYKAGAGTNEQNSNFKAVNFVSATDLHLSGTSITDVDLLGTPIPGITTDIDTQPRSATTPTQGADEGTAVMPVEITVFKGENKGSYNLLNWTIATESNNMGFDVERSKDGADFTAVGFVKSKAANGNSSEQLHYSFNDVTPFSFDLYYRLKQVDKDGRFKYSAIIRLKDKGLNKLEITKLYPNPVKNSFSLVIGAESSGTLDINVADINGKILIRKVVSAVAGDNVVPVNSASLAPGMYVIRVSHSLALETATLKFVK